MPFRSDTASAVSLNPVDSQLLHLSLEDELYRN